MKIAIIDLGTNTFNLLIAEVISKKRFKEIYNTKVAVKLGEGGINKRYITPEAFKRGTAALKNYSLIIKKHKPDKVIALATSAIREASNGKIFISNIKKETNISIETIPGNKEAELIYRGICEAVEMSNEKSLIIDIGGGSVEFIIANKKKIFWKKSFLLGVARILDKFKPTDPITKQQVQKIENYLSQKLKPLFEAVKKHPVTELIGSSGSFESLAAMIAHRFYSPKILHKKTEYLFNLNDYNKIYKSLLLSDKAQRLKMKGLIEMRADMILISSIFISLIIQKLNINKMRLSTYSLKEGVITELIN